jgi:beta-alanine--pyruvate transaminase
LIFDEVITGFGRAGDVFGAQAFGVTPDILNVAKCLTNGAIPMGAVFATGEIYKTFMEAGGPEYAIEFPHGYTYSAHPVACAAGIAAMEVFKKEDMVGKVRAFAPYFEDGLHSLKGTKYVVDIRNFGTAGAVQIAAKPGEPARRPWEIALKMFERGFYVRWSGDSLAFAPPFVTEREDFDKLINALADTIPTVD